MTIDKELRLYDLYVTIALQLSFFLYVSPVKHVEV